MHPRGIIPCVTTISILIAQSYGQTFTADPCNPAEYKKLNDPHRSTGFLTAPPVAPLCDDRLRRGWYRFTSMAGGEMPTTCQETNKCGTTKPIWVSGSNPTFEDGIVMRNICVNMNSSNPQDKHCCEYSEDIFMKNCGDFFVYYLYPTIDCDMAYCAGNIPPCRVGKWSNNSFPPCKDPFPVLKSPPVISGPRIQNNSLLGFQCEVVYGDDDPDQRFEVVWTFNGKSDPSIQSQLLSGSQRTATLDVSLITKQLDSNISCQVRSYYVGHEEDKSGFLTSNVTYFGMQLTTPPVLSGPILPDNRSFIFQCNMIDNSTNPDQVIEVFWTFDDQQDASLPSQIISGANQTAVLDGSHLKGHLNTKVGCQARVVIPGTGAKSKFLNSNTYYAGIQVSPSPLEMSEVDFEKYISVASTIPIVCELDLDCCLTLRSHVNVTSAVSFMNTCEHRICSSDWDPRTNMASIKIGVVPTRNILVAGSRGMLLSLEAVLPSSSDSYFNIFEGYRPDPIQITVKDETAFTCSLTGDPHIMGFDFKLMYDLYKSGDFVAYVAPDRDFMIQVRTVPCGGGSVACICGIVVRERNDVIKVSNCGTQSSGQTSIDIAYKLSPGTIVQRSTDGYRFGIYLPSGSEVKIDSGGTNVYISIPASDKGRGKGICGTNDGNQDNDFTHPDGQVDPPCTQRCIPDAFLESWRVSGNESLFEVVPEPVNTTDQDYAPSTMYCSCLKNLNSNSSILCSERQHIQTANTACPNCPAITNLLVPCYVAGVGWVKPGTNKPDPPFIPPEIKPVDPNKQWPNDQGVTESQANDICSKAIQKSQLYSQCQKFEQIKISVVSDCLADILFGGTTDFLDDVTTAFTSQCQLKLASDPTNYDTNKDGHQVIKPDLTDICPMECLKHGRCGEKGHCTCNDEWEGETCLIDSRKGPQLVQIQGGAVCDVTQRVCGTINIDVTNINFLHNLMYRVQAVDELGNNVGDPILTTATFLTPTTITCTLPPLVIEGQSTQIYNISASKNGTLFGNVLTFRVFDGTCLDCDPAACREKSTSCHIANVCYKNGEVDKNNGNRTCDITKSITRWTTLRSDQDRFPLLDTAPVFTGPNFKANGSVDFQCEVIYDGNDPEQVFEVVWTFSGQPDPSVPSQLLFGEGRIVTLDISFLKGQVDTNVGCQVRSYYTGSEINRSGFVGSNTTYFGIQIPPVLTGPISPDNKSFVFQCQILYDTQNSSQEIEVAWTFSGLQDPTLPLEVISGDSKTVELNGSLLMGHLGTQVGCQARLIYPESDVKTRFINSNTYFAGIQISPNPLEISEVDFEKYVTVASTIPIICELDLDCCLTLRSNVNVTSAVSFMNTCEHRICSSDWDPRTNMASIKIGVVPTRNILVAGSRGMLLSLEAVLPSSSDSYFNVFEGYRPDPIQITVKDETAFTCSLTGDPHIMGFDFKLMYDLYKSGDFVAYVAPDRDFMIQVRTVPCGGGSVACICGIVVRERNDVIKVSNCGTQSSGQTSIDIAYKLSPGTIVQRSTDGYRFGIYLPSGSEVKIDSGGTNVYISIPASDKGRGKGICGTNDGNQDNDFTHPDGQVDPPCTQRCIPDAFLESWRVSGNESLFEVVPEPVNTTDQDYGPSTMYCSCLKNLNSNSSILCSERQHIQTANTACPNCPAITNLLVPCYVAGVGWVKPGTNKPDPPFIPPEIKPVDPNKQWPNDQGVTESQANDICSKAIQKSQLYSQCQKFEQIKISVVSDCLADILFGGTTDFLDDVTTAFTSQCQLKLASDPTNYDTNKDGHQVIKPDLTDICPMECLKHGRCGEKGHCTCNDEWEGETCLIDSRKGPQLVQIQGGAVCDVTQRVCGTINIDVTNINFLHNLMYRVQAVDELGNNVGDPILTTATFLTPTTITCTLPPLVIEGQSTQIYNISASKNGTLFGNVLTFRVFDGTCLDCDPAACREKSTSCHIANVCYKNGEVDKNNGNRTCDITKSITRWTTLRSDQDRFPLLDTAPVFTGPNFKANGSVDFQCEVIYNGNDPEQVFEVVWTFNGQPDPSVPSQLLFGEGRIVTLDISFLKGHIDTNVGCQVRSYYTGSEINRSAFFGSNTTYFGIQIPPVLTGPISPDNKSFIFQCQILYDTQNSSQEIEVAWTFSGQQDPTLPLEVISGDSKTVELNGSLLMGHLGTQVGCQARLIYPESDVKTRFINSNTYFAGIQIKPDPLEISEIDFEKYMTVTSTIPIICDHDLECCLIFKLNVNKTAAVSLMNSCEYKMCSTHWDPYLKRASIQIGVVPARNILLQGSRNVLLALDVIPSLNSGAYLRTFENYQPNPLQITIKDETAFRCSLTGDPHIMGFDLKFMYDLYKSGDFVAYVAPDRDFMIQVRTVPCGGGSVACICGIVVRERNDVIKVSKCNANSGPTTIDIAYKLSQGAIVQRSSDGNRFGIYLSSGSEVKIESGGTNVYISIPAFDKGRGRGICGTNDGVEDNDLTHPDGTVDTACSQRCIPDAFLESWRVTGNESLFEVVPEPVNATDPIFGSSSQYCSCLESSSGNSTVSCSAREHVLTANTACPNCPVITDSLTPSYVIGVGWVRPGTNKPDPPFVHPEITQVVDPNKQWPNVQGVTEAQARDLCMHAIQKSLLYSQCQNIQRLTNSVISDCLADILQGGTTDFLDDITSSFTSQCQLTLAQNPDNYVTNTDGQQVIKPNLIDICPVECLKHGQCDGKGHCVCQKGWEGETCLIESGKGPQLVEIKNGELCDITQTRCDTINIDVTNIIFMNSITYRVQIVDEQGTSVGSPVLTIAIFLTPTTISCTLPALEGSSQRYKISATKDGTLFGNELLFRVFDGTCLDCDLSRCKAKNTSCHINNTCYKDGESDKYNGNRTCNITISTSRWTTNGNEQDLTPHWDTPPVLTGPHIKINGSNFFQCEVVYNFSDHKQVFEFVWTFNGQPQTSVISQLLTGYERFATLDIASLQGQVDTFIACKVRTYYLGHESSSSGYLASNAKYFGLPYGPILTGPIIYDNKSFSFQCEVNFEYLDESQEIEVGWTFDGEQDHALHPLIVNSTNRIIVLDGAQLHGHLDTRVGCQARLVYSESNVSTIYITSNTYFAGIQVEPSPLAVSEVDFEKYITLTSTIPILCDDQDIDCCMTFKLNMNETSAVSLINSCDHKICYSDWDGLWKNASVKIGIIPTRNVLVRGSNDVFMTFQAVTPAGHGSYMDIFQSYKPGRLQINVKDETAYKCSFTGDPHIMGFDLRGGYNLFLSGDFVAYTAPERDFMIQVRTVPCARVACVCGITVRERNNVIKVDKCTSSAQAVVSIAYELSPGTVVQSSTDGNRFGIYLPSGSEVRIESGGLNVYITIPAFDKGRGRGICGTNDGVQDNDFTYPNGTIDRGCNGGCFPNAFFESWRVTQNSSLFEAVPDPVNTTDPDNGSTTQYCSCQDNSNGNSSVVCSARQHIQRTNTACPNCPDITDLLVPSYVVGVGWVRPGSNKPDPPFVHPEIPPVDSNKQWPTDDGITESQARDMCTKAMQKSQLYQQCQSNKNLNTSIMSDCLTDILYGGTTEFLDDITSSFTSQCQLHLAENADNYITNAGGEQVMKPELLDHICPAECYTHGQCREKGQCQCQDGWEGETCLIESGKGPHLVEIRGGSLCDMTERECDHIHIDINNINFSDKLQCVVQEADVTANNSFGARTLTTAVYLTPNTITCTLPVLSLSTKKYNISATKDGLLFGNELSFRAYDGTCLDCNTTDCEEKRSACHINNVCYKNGETEEKDANKICDVNTNTFDWTLKTTGVPDFTTQGSTPVQEVTPAPVYPTRPPHGQTLKPCQFCFGG